MEVTTYSSTFGEGILLREVNHRIANEFTAALGRVTSAASRSENQEVKAILLIFFDVLAVSPHFGSVLDASEHIRRVSAT